jgi:hypothetical protein
MHVEHVHEHADLERVAVEIRIARLLDADDLAVRRGKHGIGLARHLARRIAEELGDEQHGEPRDESEEPESGPRQTDGDDDGEGEEVQPSRAMMGCG